MHWIGGIVFSVMFVIMRWALSDKGHGYCYEEYVAPPTRSFGWIFWRLFFGGAAVILIVYLIVKD